MEMQVVHLAVQLEGRGHEVVVLCFPGSPIFKASRGRGLECMAIALDSYFQPPLTFQLGRFLRRRKFDILHCHYSKDLWHLIPATECTGGGSVILSKGVGPGKRKNDPLHSWLYMHVDCLIAKSEYLHHRIIEAYPIDPKRVVTLNNGVDLNVFDPESQNRDRVRNELSVQEEELLVGIVGRITPAKGHMEFLKAASNVRKQFPCSKFLIVGGSSSDESWYEEKIKRLAVELGLGETVVFTGHREDIPTLLSALDLFALTSYTEAFPNVLIEAMAMKKACVATRAGGVLDVVEDGTCVSLVPPGDARALSEALVCLLGDEEKRKALGRAARRRVEKKFNLHHMIAALEELYLHIRNGERLDGGRSHVLAE